MPPPPEPPTENLSELTPNEVATRIANDEKMCLIDCRPEEERSIATIEGSIHAPIQELSARLESLYEHDGEELVVFCHHGIRSRQAALLLHEAGFEKVHSMSGGIDRWSLEVDDSIVRY
jgi:adenylyltransferase/sulfurtransferase